LGPVTPLLSSSMQQASLKNYHLRVLDKKLAHISSYLMLSEDKNWQTYEPQTKLNKSGCNSVTTVLRLLTALHLSPFQKTCIFGKYVLKFYIGIVQ
jgi:hypothetical protein